MKPRKYYVAPKEAVKVYPDGREVCSDTAAGKREYKSRTEEMRLRQHELCPICTYYLAKEDATFEHEIPRGFNGGFRDDRIYVPVDICDDEGNVIEIKMVPRNFATHGKCNAERGSKRNLSHREVA
jgi:hypothetical protein